MTELELNHDSERSVILTKSDIDVFYYAIFSQETITVIHIYLITNAFILTIKYTVVTIISKREITTFLFHIALQVSHWW